MFSGAVTGDYQLDVNFNSVDYLWANICFPMWLNSLVALQWRGADVLGLAPQLKEEVDRGRIKGATVVGDEVHCAFAALSDQLLNASALNVV